MVRRGTEGLTRTVNPISHNIIPSPKSASHTQAKRAAARTSAERIKPALEGMDFMIACYEDELKKPIRNLVNGRLARTLLIQVQHQELLRK